MYLNVKLVYVVLSITLLLLLTLNPLLWKSSHHSKLKNIKRRRTKVLNEIALSIIVGWL